MELGAANAQHDVTQLFLETQLMHDTERLRSMTVHVKGPGINHDWHGGSTGDSNVAGAKERRICCLHMHKFESSANELFIDLMLIAQSTVQGHLRAFHKFKSRTS